MEERAGMQIRQFFLSGDIKGAIAYMRGHEEFKDVLPAYTAIFEDGEYRTSTLSCGSIRYITAISFTAACRRRRPPISCGHG